MIFIQICMLIEPLTIRYTITINTQNRKQNQFLIMIFHQICIYSLFTWDIVPKVVRTEDIVLDNFSAPFRKARLESADTLPRLMLFQVRSAASFVFGDFSFTPSPVFSNRSCKRWRKFREGLTISGEFRTASTSRWNVNDTLRESGRILSSRYPGVTPSSPPIVNLGLSGASSEIIQDRPELIEGRNVTECDETRSQPLQAVENRSGANFYDHLIWYSGWQLEGKLL